MVVESTAVLCMEIGNQRHGRYDQLDENGRVALRGQYLHGQPDGRWTQFDSGSGVGKELGSYTLYQGVGTVRSYRLDGSVEKQFGVSGNENHGGWVEWHESVAVKAVEGNFSHGKRSGTWVHRDESNAIVREVDYDDGSIWLTRFYERGSLVRKELSKKALKQKEEREARQAEKRSGSAGIIGMFRSDPSIDVYGGLLSTDPGKDVFGRMLQSDPKGVFGGLTGGGSGYGGLISNSQVDLGTAVVHGGLGASIVRRYLRRRQRVLQNCFERAAVVNRSLKGTIAVKFVIASSGKVAQATASGVGGKKLHQCIAKSVRRTMFPKSRGGGAVAVRFPITFKP